MVRGKGRDLGRLSDLQAGAGPRTFREAGEFAPLRPRECGGTRAALDLARSLRLVSKVPHGRVSSHVEFGLHLANDLLQRRFGLIVDRGRAKFSELPAGVAPLEPA